MTKDHSVFKDMIFFSFNQHCGLILSCTNLVFDWNWFSCERCGPWASCSYWLCWNRKEPLSKRHRSSKQFFESQEMRVMVCAPTGAAASNMSWYTLNAAFLLAVNVKRSDDYIPLSGERLAALKETNRNIKV